MELWNYPLFPKRDGQFFETEIHASDMPVFEKRQTQSPDFYEQRTGLFTAVAPRRSYFPHPIVFFFVAGTQASFYHL